MKYFISKSSYQLTTLTPFLGKEKPPELPAGTFYKPTFFEFLLEEFYACRESVGIIDMSSFSKMSIQVS